MPDDSYEPSILGIVSDLNGLRELMLQKTNSLKELLDEREKQTRQALSSLEKAITKAEAAQREYNERSNEFRGQLEDQAKRLLSKDEYWTAHKGLEDRIGRIDTDVRQLQTNQSQMAGVRERSLEGKQQNMWIIGLVIGVCIAAAEIILRLVGK